MFISDCCCSSPTTNATNFRWNNYVRQFDGQTDIVFLVFVLLVTILQQDEKTELQRYNFMITFYTYIIIIIIIYSSWNTRWQMFFKHSYINEQNLFFRLFSYHPPPFHYRHTNTIFLIQQIISESLLYSLIQHIILISSSANLTLVIFTYNST